MNKVVKVIESCRNLAQLESAKKYSSLWLNKNGRRSGDIDFFDSIINSKRLELVNGEKNKNKTF